MQNKKKRIALWSFSGLLIVGSVFALSRVVTQPQTGSGNSATLTPSIVETWVRGNKDAKTVLTEYSDFQCPACAAYYPVLKQIEKDFEGKLRFEYRHFPLQQHANAVPAAHAAEAAGIQGKFWEMHDMLFEHQRDWEEKYIAKDVFVQYAGTLGLDVSKFNKDFDSDAVKKKVESDLKTAQAMNLDHTPTFFLNGKEIANPQSYEAFKALISSAIPAN